QLVDDGELDGRRRWKDLALEVRDLLARRQVDEHVAGDAVEPSGDLLDAPFEFRFQLRGRRGLRGERGAECERCGVHTRILRATAVMSSLGGVSPRKSCTAEKMASTISRAVDVRTAPITSSSRSAPNSRPSASLASNTPSVQNTKRSPLARSNDTSSYVEPANEPSGTPGSVICSARPSLHRTG